MTTLSSDLINKKMTRREFLIHLVLFLVILSGLGKLISTPSNQSSAGYGKAPYGK